MTTQVSIGRNLPTGGKLTGVQWEAYKGDVRAVFGEFDLVLDAEYDGWAGWGSECEQSYVFVSYSDVDPHCRLADKYGFPAVELFRDQLAQCAGNFLQDSLMLSVYEPTFVEGE